MTGDRLGRVMSAEASLLQFVMERGHPSCPPSPSLCKGLPLVMWVFQTSRQSDYRGCGCRVYEVDEFSVRVLERTFATTIDRNSIGMCRCMGRFVE